jgi:phosphohistidine phosphatase SixA
VDLLIVRHAIAMERDARRWPDDRLRPLSVRGIARGRKAAAGIRRVSAKPELFLVSPLLRAQQTAQILQRFARWPRTQVWEELAAEAPPGELLTRLGRNAADFIALVGHEPQLSALLGLCLPGGAATGLTLRKMGAALVRFRGRARPGRAQLVWFAPPKLLRALAKGRPVSG